MDGEKPSAYPLIKHLGGNSQDTGLIKLILIKGLVLPEIGKNFILGSLINKWQEYQILSQYTIWFLLTIYKDPWCYSDHWSHNENQLLDNLEYGPSFGVTFDPDCLIISDPSHKLPLNSVISVKISIIMKNTT